MGKLSYIEICQKFQEMDEWEGFPFYDFDEALKWLRNSGFRLTALRDDSKEKNIVAIVATHHRIPDLLYVRTIGYPRIDFAGGAMYRYDALRWYLNEINAIL